MHSINAIQWNQYLSMNMSSEKIINPKLVREMIINLKILFAPRSQFNQFSQSNICMSLKKKVYKSMKLMFQVERKKNPTFYESVALVSSAGPSIFIVYHNILWHHIFCWNIRNNYMQITSNIGIKKTLKYFINFSKEDSETILN
jgi:hypothetical protein